MEYIEVTAKTVDDAITEALIKLSTTSDKLEYEVVDKGSNGILGLFNTRPAKIKAKKVLTPEDRAEQFLNDIFMAMNMQIGIDIKYKEKERSMNINLLGKDMGVLIGKRGQTLDSLQYLVSRVLNKDNEDYIRVKLDTENYRERRRETLEKLARSIANKVKKTRREESLEPMNPYERRIIHSTLQNDKFVITKSEGEDPYRYVVIAPKGNRQ